MNNSLINAIVLCKKSFTDISPITIPQNISKFRLPEPAKASGLAQSSNRRVVFFMQKVPFNKTALSISQQISQLEVRKHGTPESLTRTKRGERPKCQKPVT